MSCHALVKFRVMDAKKENPPAKLVIFIAGQHCLLCDGVFGLQKHGGKYWFAETRRFSSDYQLSGGAYLGLISFIQHLTLAGLQISNSQYAVEIR